jgi:hypothetical protein
MKSCHLVTYLIKLHKQTLLGNLFLAKQYQIKQEILLSKKTTNLENNLNIPKDNIQIHVHRGIEIQIPIIIIKPMLWCHIKFANTPLKTLQSLELILICFK